MVICYNLLFNIWLPSGEFLRWGPPHLSLNISGYKRFHYLVSQLVLLLGSPDVRTFFLKKNFNSLYL